jgi:hypothetical protein
MEIGWRSHLPIDGHLRARQHLDHVAAPQTGHGHLVRVGSGLGLGFGFGFGLANPHPEPEP